MLAVMIGAADPATAAEADPFRSVMWDDMRALVLGDAPFLFDDRVKVMAPASAEDALNVPVAVDATALGTVERIAVFADMNPIPRILDYRPIAARPTIALRLKLQQATAIRAAALTPDGVWHVGGVFVDAAGGGCTSPSLAHGDPTWERHLGEVQARAWPAGQGSAEGQPKSTRLRLRVRHPMDTGLAPGIPAFFIETLVVRDGDGRELARIDSHEPVSENPVFTVEVTPPEDGRALQVTGRDNNGTEIRASVPLAWRQSSLETSTR
jgi:sulfur-oxidizing protein SoxY